MATSLPALTTPYSGTPLEGGWPAARGDARDGRLQDERRYRVLGAEKAVGHLHPSGRLWGILQGLPRQRHGACPGLRAGLPGPGGKGSARAQVDHDPPEGKQWEATRRRFCSSGGRLAQLPKGR